jgi:hypothetical protein
VKKAKKAGKDLAQLGQLLAFHSHDDEFGQ